MTIVVARDAIQVDSNRRCSSVNYYRRQGMQGSGLLTIGRRWQYTCAAIEKAHVIGLMMQDEGRQYELMFWYLAARAKGVQGSEMTAAMRAPDLLGGHAGRAGLFSLTRYRSPSSPHNYGHNLLETVTGGLRRGGSQWHIQEVMSREIVASGSPVCPPDTTTVGCRVWVDRCTRAVRGDIDSGAPDEHDDERGGGGGIGSARPDENAYRLHHSLMPARYDCPDRAVGDPNAVDYQTCGCY
ncbi:hypothetical protein CERSUDRAFT_124784 [Gelatoporia subvermispora B]|uniref:Uncharacterized protein n=1 Tax=Ceriporiopsis subvermispora (strain B) TaxID=914234 RepID=M2PHG5_CERS8|nr:hypothetical protein CERSUDRAFT_124784 [Gelatoporia subvermispora B]